MLDFVKLYCSTSKFLLFSFILIVCGGPVHAAATILDWNSPSDSGTTWSGWTWYEDGADDYGSEGWRKDDGQFYSGGSNWMPRVHGINGYSGSHQLATVVTDEIAPSTSSGGALKVYDAPDDQYNAAGQWYLFGDNFGTHGYADGSTDRLSFYVKFDGIDADIADNWYVPAYTAHFGTYLCWEGGGIDGQDCPTEADNNQHYYHYMTVNDGAWLHVQIDQHPIHQRSHSQPNEPINDPVFVSDGKHYFENMNTFYLEIRNSQSQPTYYLLDEVELWNQPQDENEESIGSVVYVGYWDAADKWEIGFGSVYPGSPMQATFEVRYSTSPITNANFDSATIIEPEYYEYGSTGRVRNSDSGWSKFVWTRFEIPDAVESSTDTIYFAIRDVSATANGDGYNSPTTLIKTIDYALSASSPTTPSTIMPPGNLLLNSSN